MPPPRALHVTPYSEHAWAYGGIPRVVAAQTHGLAARGLTVTVATTDACDRERRLTRPHAGRRLQPFQLASDDDLDVHVFPNLSNALAYRLQLFLPVGLGSYLRESAHDFDVAHLHGCHNLPGATAARWLRRAGVPYVVQPNGTAPRIERRRLLKLVFDATIGRRVLPSAAAVIAVTEAERRQLHRLGVDGARIVVIPNPLCLEEFAEQPAEGVFRHKFGLGEGPLVLYLGQLSPRKRVDVAIRAVAGLDRDDVQLAIVGADMGRGARLRSLAHRLGISSRTVFTGLLQGDERLQALADADVVVYPSSDEIFGLVPLEALLCGTPVVVSDDCGCGEVIGTTGGGLVVEHGNPSAVATAITDVLSCPDVWKRSATLGARRARDLYARDVICRRLHSLYARLAPAIALEGGTE